MTIEVPSTCQDRHVMDCLSRERPLCDNMATLSDTYLDDCSSAKDAETLRKMRKLQLEHEERMRDKEERRQREKEMWDEEERMWDEEERRE